MGDFGSRLDRLRVTAELPGSGISATFRDRRETILSLTDDSYYRATESEMEHRLVALGRLLWVAWTRGYYEELSAATGRTITGELPPVTDKDRRFRDLRSQVEAAGSSADDRIRVRARGLQALSAHIAPGTLRSLSKEEFVAAVRAAIREMLDDYLRKISAIKGQVFADFTAGSGQR